MTDRLPTEREWEALWNALPESHNKVEVTIIASRGSRRRFVSLGSGMSTAIGHCGQWVQWDGLIGSESVAATVREYTARRLSGDEGGAG